MDESFGHSRGERAADRQRKAETRRRMVEEDKRKVVRRRTNVGD